MKRYPRRHERPAGACRPMLRTAGATLGVHAEPHPPRAPMRPPPHGSSLRRSTVPRPSPGPWQERPSAGRSPGSRVDARYATFPGPALTLRPSGRPLITKEHAHRAHRLQLQGQPRHEEARLPHRIPFEAPRGTDAICDPGLHRFRGATVAQKIPAANGPRVSRGSPAPGAGAAHRSSVHQAAARRPREPPQTLRRRHAHVPRSPHPA
jgi:hypothetical protein